MKISVDKVNGKHMTALVARVLFLYIAISYFHPVVDPEPLLVTKKRDIKETASLWQPSFSRTILTMIFTSWICGGVFNFMYKLKIDKIR